MKHVKTFENFTYSVNEEEGIFGDAWQGIKKFFSGLRDKAAQEVGEKIKSELEARKDDPKVQEFLKELNERVAALPAEDKAKLEEMKNNPQETIEAIKEVQDEVTESLRLNEEIDWKNITGKILKVLGLSGSLAGLITWAVACLQGYGMLSAIGGVMLYSIAWVPVVAVVTAVIVGPILMTVGDSLKGEFDEPARRF